MMLLFLVVVSVLVLVVLIMLLKPLLRPQVNLVVDANLERRTIFRQQFEELEQDRLNAILDEAQYAQAKSELERRMLDEVGVVPVPVAKAQPDRRLAFIFLLLIPIAAVFIYLKIGSIYSVATAHLPTSSQQAAQQSALADDIEPFLQALRNKLKENPQDGAGWALLGRSYLEIKRFDEAVKAYEKAEQLIPADPQLLTDYADALAANGHAPDGLPKKLVLRALKLNPKHVKALMLAGSIAFDQKDYAQAIDYWGQLEQVLPADSEWLPEVKASIGEARKLSGIAFTKPVVKKAAPEPVINSAGISGTVRLAPTLFSQLDGNATLFVFARPTQGPPMPLAIVRGFARNLPYNYHLDDSSALAPNHKLSQAGEVVIVARISKTGDAKAVTGDLQGESAIVKANAGVVNLEINQRVP
jgi:cytochrome c-type biogenesis protein CcmH